MKQSVLDLDLDLSKDLRIDSIMSGVGCCLPIETVKLLSPHLFLDLPGSDHRLCHDPRTWDVLGLDQV